MHTLTLGSMKPYETSTVRLISAYTIAMKMMKPCSTG